MRNFIICLALIGLVIPLCLASNDTLATARRGSHSKHRSVRLNFRARETPSPLDNVTIATTQTEVLITISVGGQPFEVIFDTGSAALVLVSDSVPLGQGCHLYNQSAASSKMPCQNKCTCNSTADACQAVVSYADGSGGTGLLIMDTFTVSTDEAVSVANAPLISLFEQENGFVRCDGSGSDGIWGVAMRPLNCFPSGSEYCPLTVMDRLLNQRGMRDAFSMWVGNRTGNAGGVLTLGGWDPTHFVGDMVWTPLIRGRYYMVGLSSLAVDENFVIENNAAIFGQGGIVDSGTTLLLFPTAVLAQLQAYMIKSYPQCANVTDVWTAGMNGTPNIFTLTIEQVLCYPPIHIYTTTNVPITVPPTAYWRFLGNDGLPEGTAVYYWGIGSASTVQFTILGDIAMRPYYVAFDRQEARVGFARYVGVDPLPEAPTVTPLPPDDSGNSVPVWLVAGICVGIGVCAICVVLMAISYKKRTPVFFRVLPPKPPRSMGVPINVQPLAVNVPQPSRLDVSKRYTNPTGTVPGTPVDGTPLGHPTSAYASWSRDLNNQSPDPSSSRVNAPFPNAASTFPNAAVSTFPNAAKPQQGGGLEKSPSSLSGYDRIGDVTSPKSRGAQSSSFLARTFSSLRANNRVAPDVEEAMPRSASLINSAYKV